MTGCCRGLSAKDCIARPYGCNDEPKELDKIEIKYERNSPLNCTGWCGGVEAGKILNCPYKNCKYK